MNKINEKMDCQTRLRKSAASGDWACHSPRAGAKIFARRIGDAMQMAHVQKSGAQSCARPPRSFGAVAQAGRSMIEMLGVLAIIGVLTIGGLMGYRYAMNKHKANLILNDVSLAMADLTVQDPDGGAIARQAVAFNPDSGLAMESERTEDGNNIVYVNGVPKAVCQILIQIKPTDAYENIYDGDLNALTSCNDNQTMAFGSKDSGEPPVTPECQNDSNCAADEICQNGHCVVKPIPTDPCDPNPCSNGGICSNGKCTCINGFTGKYCDDAPECIVDEQCDELQFCQNYVCVCQVFEGCVQQASDCKCEKCETAYIKKDGKCEKCTAPKVPNADQTACECPKIENCKEYNDSTCACDTCEDGKCVMASTCSESEQECSAGSDKWCCNAEAKCGSAKGECMQCSPTEAKNNEEICTKCGWNWEIEEFVDYSGQGDYEDESYACGGDSYCQAVYGSGVTWQQVSSFIGRPSLYACFGENYCQTEKGQQNCHQTTSYGSFKGCASTVTGEGGTQTQCIGFDASSYCYISQASGCVLD